LFEGQKNEMLFKNRTGKIRGTWRGRLALSGAGEGPKGNVNGEKDEILLIIASAVNLIAAAWKGCSEKSKEGCGMNDAA